MLTESPIINTLGSDLEGGSAAPGLQTVQGGDLSYLRRKYDVDQRLGLVAST